MRGTLARPGIRAAAAAAALVLLVALAVTVVSGGVAGGPAPLATRAGARGAPETFRFEGGGYGHGVGMSQYGALGMALRGRAAGEIIGFYYGGAQVAAADLPPSIRVGMLEARLDGVTVRGEQVPGTDADAGVLFRTRGRDGRTVERALPRAVPLTLRPDAGGVSVFEGDTRRLGPSAPGSEVTIAYERGAAQPSLLTLPQADRTLRWGYLEVSAVHDGQRPRLRAVATMTWRQYLRGIAETPASWPAEAQRAQAIAARSYALAVVEAAGQRREQDVWSGCDCAVRPDVRDQVYLGWERERGEGGDAWVAAADGTDGQVVRYDGTLVRTLYYASSGGHTAPVSTVFGGPDQPWYPSQPDPDDAADGRNPHFRWTEERTAEEVTEALASLGVGEVTSIRAARLDPSGRVHEAEVLGTDGSTRVPGTHLRTALSLKSTKFTVTTA